MTAHDPVDHKMPLVVGGVPVEFALSCTTGIPCRVDSLHPAPGGQTWAQYSSQDLPGSPDPGSFQAMFRFRWQPGVCTGITGSPCATWLSDDAAQRWGAVVNDFYDEGTFPPPTGPALPSATPWTLMVAAFGLAGTAGWMLLRRREPEIISAAPAFFARSR